LVKEETMITLYASGPYFGLPDPSPFCVKAMMLLKMAGLDCERKRMKFSEAPKGKVPYIRDGELLLGDSHFIGRHLEQKHGADFSGGYGAAELAKGWAVARMMEEHFYFLIVHERWLRGDNFDKGPRQFFLMAPAPIRPLVRAMVLRKVRQMVKAQGLGRHDGPERLSLAIGDLDAVEALLGGNRYLLGNKASGADASVFPFIWSGSASFFTTEIGDYVRTRPRLMGYLERLRSEFFPGFKL
jgi:glutathione S-transferase